MLHHVDVGHGGGQHHGVGEWGELVTKIDAGEYGTGHQWRRHAQAVAYAHHGDAGGGRRAPGGAGGKGGEGADDQGRQQEDGRVYHLEPEVDDAGDYAARDPGADQGTDGDQYQDGAHALGDTVDGGLLQGFVIMAEPDAESHDDEPGDEQCQLDWQVEHAGEGEGQGQENGQAGKHLWHVRQSNVVMLVLHRYFLNSCSPRSLPLVLWILVSRGGNPKRGRNLPQTQGLKSQHI
ncbi:hypothetical protein D3C80_1159080 [compost metagenome]